MYSLKISDNRKQIDTHPVSYNYWEKLSRNDPNLTDSNTIASPMKSTAFIKDAKDWYSIGDVVTVVITLLDYNGRRKLTGGDSIRIWAKDPANEAFSAGIVFDNNDGTYHGILTLMWSGNVTIVTRIDAPREIIRYLYQSIESGNTKIHINSLFKKETVKEIQNCSPMEERIKDYVTFCNYTLKNSGLPWYCKKPSTLGCEDLAGIGYDGNLHQTFTTHEHSMFQR